VDAVIAISIAAKYGTQAGETLKARHKPNDRVVDVVSLDHISPLDHHSRALNHQAGAAAVLDTKAALFISFGAIVYALLPTTRDHSSTALVLSPVIFVEALAVQIAIDARQTIRDPTLARSTTRRLEHICLPFVREILGLLNKC